MHCPFRPVGLKMQPRAVRREGYSSFRAASPPRVTQNGRRSRCAKQSYPTVARVAAPRKHGRCPLEPSLKLIWSGGSMVVGVEAVGCPPNGDRAIRWSMCTLTVRPTVPRRGPAEATGAATGRPPRRLRGMAGLAARLYANAGYADGWGERTTRLSPRAGPGAGSRSCRMDPALSSATRSFQFCRTQACRSRRSHGSSATVVRASLNSSTSTSCDR